MSSPAQTADEVTDPFLTRFHGRFRGVMRWHELDALWAVIERDAAAGWYLYVVGEPPPADPANAEIVLKFMRKIANRLREEHDEDYCGIVYADDLDAPTMVKIYDPANLGVVCGPGDTAPLPGWVMTKLAPIDLPAAFPKPQVRRRWWQRLLSR
jgi:hypothetical protein